MEWTVPEHYCRRNEQKEITRREERENAERLRNRPLPRWRREMEEKENGDRK